MVERLTRYALAFVGVIAAAWGLRLMWKRWPTLPKVNFGEWLIGGVLLHDLILANVVVLVGWLLAKTLPPHLRGFVQAALVVIALTGSMAFFVIWRQDKYASASFALLQQNYVLNFSIIVAIIVVCTGVLYAASLRNIRKSRSE